MIIFKVLVIAAIAVAAVVVLIYNRLVRERNRCDSAWSDIDVQLQRRHDLIPRLVQVVDQYAGYERATLEAVSELRAQAMSAGSIAERGEVEEALSSGIVKIVALAEQYPDLKASENFLKLQNDLVETENYLQFARRFYNGAVRQYNTLIEVVPNNFVASWFSFAARDFFQKASDEIAAVPLVELGEVE